MYTMVLPHGKMVHLCIGLVHSSNGDIRMKISSGQICYYIDQLCTPSVPIGLVEMESKSVDQLKLVYGDERWWKLRAMAVLILDWSLSGLTYLSDYSAYQSILSIVSILTFLVAVNLEVATRLHNYKIKMLEKICRSQLSNCSVMSYLHIISKDCFTDMYKK